MKAAGIAQDLFDAQENYVLPVQSLRHREELARGFSWLLANENEIRTRLSEIMPSYQERAVETGKEVDRLWEECRLL